MFNSVQKAIIYKDTREIIRNKQILIPMIIVPLVLMLLLPIALFVGVAFIPSDTADITRIIHKIPFVLPYERMDQNLIYLALNIYFLPMFLIIPVMTGSLTAAGSFVNEKEKKTLETLFYMPATVNELFRAKVIASFLPAYFVTLVIFIAYTVVVNMGGYFYFHRLIFPDIRWLIIIVLLCPALAIMSLSLVVWVSARVSSFQESQQVVAFLVLPMLLLVIGQATGLFFLNNLMLLIISIILILLDIIILRFTGRRFTYEKLLK